MTCLFLTQFQTNMVESGTTVLILCCTNSNTFLLTPKKQCPTKETLSSSLLEITIDYFHCKKTKLLSSSFTKCTNS